MNFMTISAKDPTVAFSIGNIDIQWYGLIIVCAMILGLIYVVRECRKINLTSDEGIELFLWVIPLAVVFARILYIVPARVDEYFPWNSWDDFVHAIAIWEGGITIIGGIFGGVLGGIFFTIHHRKKVNFGNTADLVVVPLLTGQIIGRLGNFVNQEAFGLPIKNEALQTFPFGVYITRPSGVEGEYSGIVYSNVPGWFCATFFYEMVWNMFGLVFCLWFWNSSRNKKYPGFMLIFYFFWYCLGRFWLEFLRIDAVPITKIAMGVISPIALIIGLLYIMLRDSQDSYKHVRRLASENALEGAALTDYDRKNYIFVGKVVANEKNPLRLLYVGLPKRPKKSKDGEIEEVDVYEHISVDFDSFEYYHVPKRYKTRFRQLKKQDVYNMQ